MKKYITLLIVLLFIPNLVFGWGSTGSGGHVIKDEDTVRPSRPNLNFKGAGVTCADSSPDTVCTIPGGGTADAIAVANSNVTVTDTGADGTITIDADGTEVGVYTAVGETLTGVLYIKEQAEAAANVAGQGQVWVDTAAPNKLMFTDDTDVDIELSGILTHERGGLELDVSAFGASLYGQTAGFATLAVDTEAEFETAVAGLNFIIDTEIDTSAELKAIVGDETGSGGALVFATAPTIATAVMTGKIDRNNVAVNDDSCSAEQGLWWYDTTDSRFEFCNANSGTPDVLGAFDSTAVDATTWSDNANASNIWTFDVSGTDHTMTAGNGLMTFSHAVTVSGAVILGDGGDNFSVASDGIDIDTSGNISNAGTISSGAITSSAGVDLGTSQALVGTTAMTIGDNNQTVNINSSDWDIDATGVATGMGSITSDGTITSSSSGFDCTGAVACPYGSGDITSVVISTDGGDVTLDGTVTTAPADDGAVIFDPSTAGESEWWWGPNHDGVGDDNDSMEARQSATPGTNVRLSIAASTGALSSIRGVTTTAAGRAITTAEMMDGIVEATAVMDLNLPDLCDSATGYSVMVVARDAEVLSIGLTDTADQIILDGTLLTADNELDSGGTTYETITLTCIAANKWLTSNREGTWVDGGAAD